MAPLALPLMAGGLALFWGAAFGLARALGGTGWPGLVALASVWALAEWARAHVLTGFPWAMPAYGLLDTPLAQLAALAGPHALNLGLFLLAAILARPGAVRLGIGLCLVAAGWLAGAFLRPDVVPRSDGFAVRVVQPNAVQSQKWQPEMAQVFYDRLIAATAAPPDAGAARPGVVIWPETAVPFLLGERPDLEADMTAAAKGAVLVAGIRRQQGRAWFNSLAVFDAGGRLADVYDKHHLTPFGEYMPMRDLASRMGLTALAATMPEGFSPGPGPRLLAVPGIPAALPLICYEMIFPDQVIAALGGSGGTAPDGERLSGPAGAARAEWIIHSTNDGWFGALAGPQQHLAQARFRAIETGLPVARAANTGISAVIAPDGSLVGSIGMGRTGQLDAVLPSPRPSTPYVRAGDRVFAGLAALTGLAALAGRLVLWRRPGRGGLRARVGQ
jgi:apolipoprotein N-acyltransferase